MTRSTRLSTSSKPKTNIKALNSTNGMMSLRKNSSATKRRDKQGKKSAKELREKRRPNVMLSESRSLLKCSRSVSNVKSAKKKKQSSEKFKLKRMLVLLPKRKQSSK